MPKFIIEREIPGIGAKSAAEMTAIAQASCNVLRNLGPEIQWIESYVAGDKTFCVYHAANAELVQEHARLSGFPADKVTEVKTIIDPATAEQAYGAQAQ